MEIPKKRALVVQPMVTNAIMATWVEVPHLEVSSPKNSMEILREWLSKMEAYIQATGVSFVV